MRNPSSNRAALRVAGAYAVAAALWILLSDRVLHALVHDAETLTALQSWKGLAFISASAGLIFYLLRAELERRRLATEHAEEREAHFRSVFNARVAGIFFFDANGRVLEANDAFLELVGRTRDDLVTFRPTWTDLIPPEEREAHARRLADLAGSGRLLPCETELVRRDGRRLPVMLGATRLEHASDRAIAFVVDLTRLRQLEHQLRHSQKLEAVGQLAGGMAHDFNNILTAIQGYGELALATANDPAVRDLVVEITRASERAAGLTHKLLAFSRRQVLEARVMDLNDVVRGMVPMLDRLLGERVRLEPRLAPRLERVRADAGQLEQVLTNLVVNARDAMPDGGTVVVETGLLRLAEPKAPPQGPLPHGPVPAGTWVTLAVRDSGEGMDPATASRIFEPFFTTKERGRGTGLGLPMAYGIVAQSGGHMEVDSAPGAGSTFRVYLPAVSVEAGEADLPHPESGASSGHEVVLLVEDEDSVREMLRSGLVSQGYTVLPARGGDEALAIVARWTESVDVVVADVVMPGLSGPDVARRLRERWPDLPVLYVSGYAADALGTGFAIGPRDLLLQKPFSPSTLARAVRAHLDTWGRAPAPPPGQPARPRS